MADAVPLGDQVGDLRAGEHPLQVVDAHRDASGLVLVLGQPADEAVHGRGVIGRGATDVHHSDPFGRGFGKMGGDVSLRPVAVAPAGRVAP